MPLVSVVIPAFNAEQTIDRTLASVREQSHRELEIVVVDDGSTDDTPTHVLCHGQVDPRVRLLRQANGGVAAARNRGIAETCGDYVAPVDADDLWHPDKISRQLQVMQASDSIGMVASCYSVIDEADGLVAEIGGTQPQTTQFLDLCQRNFIGNGSSALIRRSLLQRVGGYDPSLRARGGQGCEDLQLYLQIAEVSKIGFIREPLTAYRRGAFNMSRNSAQMLRSFDLVAEGFCRRRPELRPRFNAHRVHMLCWLIGGALRSGDLHQVRSLGRQLVTTRSLALPAALASAAARRLVAAKRQRLEGTERKARLDWAPPAQMS